jgi:hypothetical protein
VGYRGHHNCTAHIGVDPGMLFYYFFSLPDSLGAAYDEDKDEDEDYLPQQRQSTRQ